MSNEELLEVANEKKKDGTATERALTAQAILYRKSRWPERPGERDRKIGSDEEPDIMEKQDIAALF